MSKPNGAWCSHHKARKHESQLSPSAFRHVKWYRRERPRWLAIVAVIQRYPRTPLPWKGEALPAWIERVYLPLDALNPTCAECGDTEELEFQHDAPRDWVANKTSRWQRLRNYIRDIKAGRIKRLLCRSCNAAAGRPKGESEALEAAGKQRKKERAKEPF